MGTGLEQEQCHLVKWEPCSHWPSQWLNISAFPWSGSSCSLSH